MIYRVDKSDSIKKIENFESCNKIYRFEESLKQELFGSITDKTAEDINLSTIVVGIPTDELYNEEYYHIECELEQKVNNFVIRNINSSSTTNLEIVFLQDSEFVNGYRVPVKERNTLKVALDASELSEQEKSDIIKAFVLVDYIVDRNNYITKVNKRVENVNGIEIISYGKDDF